jgi:RimJ/RimL family protein N-acetyltransferase
MEIDCGTCKLRSWRLEDIGSLVKYANNRKIWLNLRDQFPHPYSQADAQSWIQNALTVIPQTSFAIDIAGEAAGSIGFRLQTDVERFSAEVGYWLGEEFWGQGNTQLKHMASIGYLHFLLKGMLFQCVFLKKQVM